MFSTYISIIKSLSSENPEMPDPANKVPQSLREEISGGLRLEWIGLNEDPLAQEDVENLKFTGRWDDLKTNHVILRLSFKNVQQENSDYTKAGDLCYLNMIFIAANINARNIHG